MQLAHNKKRNAHFWLYAKNHLKNLPICKILTSNSHRHKYQHNNNPRTNKLWFHSKNLTLMASNLPLKHEPDQVPHHQSTAKLCINWLHLSPPSIDRMTNQIHYTNPHKTKQNLRRTAMEREREDLPLRPAPLVLLCATGELPGSPSRGRKTKRESEWEGKEATDIPHHHTTGAPNRQMRTRFHYYTWINHRRRSPNWRTWTWIDG